MTTRSFFSTAALAFGMALSGGVALAQVDYLTGGIGVSSREELAAREKQFNLKVVTAAQGSGAYLAAVRMKVIDPRDSKVLLETTMDGPWLLAQLPAGKYVLEATFEGKTLTKTVDIPKAGRRQAYFYWTVAGLEEPMK